jgi:hypothetical protein
MALVEIDLGRALGQFEEDGCAEQPEDRQFHDRRSFWSIFRPAPRPAIILPTID